MLQVDLKDPADQVLQVDLKDPVDHWDQVLQVDLKDLVDHLDQVAHKDLVLQAVLKDQVAQEVDPDLALKDQQVEFQQLQPPSNRMPHSQCQNYSRICKNKQWH